MMYFFAGVFATVIGELLLAVALWLWLTRRRDDLPEECD